MIKFGVRNLRRLSNVPLISIKPITVLVGRNSSGKSTFLRSLPLLRQSVMTRTSAPILWWGDVDFGSFDKSVFHNKRDLNIEFSFGLDSVIIGMMDFYSTTKVYAPIADKVIENIEMTFVVSEFGLKTRISEVIAKYGNQRSTVCLQIDQSNTVKSITLNGTEIISAYPGSKISITPGDVFPHYSLNYEESNPNSNRAARVGPLAEGLKILSSNKKNEFDIETAFQVFSIIGQRGTTNKAYSQYGPKRFRDLAETIDLFYETATKGEIERLEQIAKINEVIPILNAISDRLTNVITNLLYIGPARARSERYYRYQDLSVSEIDSDGKNLPMFLNSLSEYYKEDLSSWVKNLFGFGIDVSNEAGHISINMIDGDNKINVVDTGYGVSQILPVLAQLWWARTRHIANQFPTILAIEQPELHLHPAHQSLLADALVRHGRGMTHPSSGRQISCIVETHSEAFVNRLGALIESGSLAAEDVQILIFSDNEDKDNVTDVRVSKFSDSGILENWPYGFFQG